MKKAYKIVCLAVVAGSIVSLLFIAGKNAFSISSRFDGKIIKKIEFIGIRKLAGGKESIVDLKNIDAESLLRAELRKNSLRGSKDAIEFNVIDIDEPLRSEKIKDTIKMLFSGSKVSDVRAEVQEYGDGVIVRFFCEELPLISRIEFRGLDKVMETDLKEKILFKEGESYRNDLIIKSLPEIKKQYAEKGLFNCVLDYKVDIDPEKDDGSVRITIDIDEGEEIKIAKFSILGTRQIRDTELKTFVETKEKKFLDDGNFKRDVFDQDKQKILSYYKQNGFLDAEIINDPNQIEYDWDNPENKEGATRAIYITIKIREGERYFFDGYDINGITGTVGDKEENEFITKESVEKQLEMVKKDTSLPGEKFSAMTASLTGGTYEYDTVLNYGLLEKDRYNISMRYAHYGHLNSRVTPTFIDRYEERIIDGKPEKRKFRKYTFTITEGTPSRIEKIYIRGCKKTKEKVVRREVLMKEDVNELFDSYKMNATRERIYNLGFFKEVNIDIRPGSREDMVNIIIDVVEQPTGTISVGGSWASSSGFSIFADIGDKNFMGEGKSVNLRINYGPTQMTSSIGITEPWLFDKPISGSASIFYNRWWKEDASSIFTNSDEDAYYEKQSYGYSLGASYRFMRYLSAGLGWTQAWKNILDASGSCSDKIFIEKNLGVQNIREISTNLTFDSRNNSLNPTRGIKAILEFGMTGGYVLRGDDHYVRYTPSIEGFYSPFNIPLLPTYPVVFQARASANFLRPPFMRNKVEKMQPRAKNEWLEDEELLYLGGAGGITGSGLLRGWDVADEDMPESWQNGLYNQILYGAEIRIPIHPQYLWMTFFFDAGSLWTDPFWEKTLSDDAKDVFAEDKANKQLYSIQDFGKADLMSYFRYSYGFGFKIQIPMMPLRFWFGKKLLWNGKKGEYFEPISGFNFQFAIGDMVF